MEEIINKVAQSTIEVFDLEDYYPIETQSQIDISLWLYDGFILKENDFRKALKNHQWSQYQNHLVAIHCSTDAVIPAWATILTTVYLEPFAKKIVLGNLSDLITSYYQEILSKIDYTIYKKKPIILKGCSKKDVPKSAYVFAIQYLLPFAKSIMYGEACSAVPLFKKQK